MTHPAARGPAAGVKMKCLSLTQPWATLVVTGKKQYETRSWSTRYRGPLLIHAAKGYPVSAEMFAYQQVKAGRLVAPPAGPSLPHGAIIGQVDLIGVWSTDNPILRDELTDVERELGDYSPGRFAWALAYPVSFACHIVQRGALGLFNVDWQEAPNG